MQVRKTFWKHVATKSRFELRGMYLASFYLSLSFSRAFFLRESPQRARVPPPGVRTIEEEDQGR